MTFRAKRKTTESRALRLILAGYLLIYFALFDLTKEHHLYIEPLLEGYFQHHEKEHGFHHHHDDIIFHDAKPANTETEIPDAGFKFSEPDDDHIADHVHATVAGPTVFSIHLDHKPALVMIKAQEAESFIPSPTYIEFSSRAPPATVSW